MNFNFKKYWLIESEDVFLGFIQASPNTVYRMSKEELLEESANQFTPSTLTKTKIIIPGGVKNQGSFSIAEPMLKTEMKKLLWQWLQERTVLHHAWKGAEIYLAYGDYGRSGFGVGIFNPSSFNVKEIYHDAEGQVLGGQGNVIYSFTRGLDGISIQSHDLK